MPIIPIESDAHWHELRGPRIGASEIYALFDSEQKPEIGDEADPFEESWSTPHEIWARKHGLIKPVQQTAIMEFGLDMEPVIAKWLAKEYGLEILKSREYHIHPEYPWLACTLDYYVLQSEWGQRLLQIKNVGTYAKYWSRDKAPQKVEMQVIQELEVTNAARLEHGQTPFPGTMIGSMHGGNPENLRLQPRPPNPEVWEAIVRVSKDFYERCLIGGEEPQNWQPKDIGHIKEMYRTAERHVEHIDLTHVSDEVEDQIAAWRTAKADETRARKRKDALLSALMRRFMVLDKKDIISAMKAETDNFIMKMDLSVSQYAPAPARTVESLEFSVKEKY